MSRRPPPLHERIKERVTAAGFTQGDLAERLGWHEMKVWRVLNGRTALSADDVEIFARLLRVPVGDLYDAKAS